MRTVIISDTHERHEQVILPEGDLLIHCGDFTNKGSFFAIENFLKWFSNQPHKYKVFTMGNHEIGTDKGLMRNEKLKLVKKFTNEYNNLFYLENSSIVINGYKIFGSPITPFFYAWAWNVNRGQEIAKYWAAIPDDTNILISHGPPYGILDLVEDNFDNSGRDLHQGCEDLRKRIDELKELKAHFFGHLHLSGGKTITENGKIFANAAICTEEYNPTNPPIIIDI